MPGCAAPTAEVSKPGDKQPELSEGAGQGSIHRLDELRFSNGPLHTSKIRAKLQKDMQTDAAVFRTQVGTCVSSPGLWLPHMGAAS